MSFFFSHVRRQLPSPQLFLIFFLIIPQMSISSPWPPCSPHLQHPLLPLLERQNTNSLHLKQIHARALKTSSNSNQQDDNTLLLFLYSRLIYYYCNATSNAGGGGSLSYACRLLSHPLSPSITPNSFCYNTLIRAHSRSSPLDDEKKKRLSIQLYRRMLLSGVSPDNHTFPFVLRASAFLFAFSEGSQIHSHIFKLGLSSDVYVANSLVHFYSSCGRLSLARQVFDDMPDRNHVSWNAIVDAYAAGGEYETALHLFRTMMTNTAMMPDAYTLQSVLCACAGLGSLSLGMWAHAFMMRKCEAKILDDILINNSLLDLYSKCGAIRMARQVFHRMPTRDVASWNVMILGYAMHGRIRESLEAFQDMRTVGGLKPNSITFVAVLSACKHGGLVTEGRRYFDLMTNEFGLQPQLEHFGCMVDLLARAGLIAEALEVVKSMRCKPDTVIWRSILDACCKQNAGTDISSLVAKHALESEELATSGTYVLLSKVYALAERWNDVGLVRRIMTEKGIKKEPGCSSIEMDGFVHEFMAGDTSHPQSEEIYEKISEVESKLAAVGYKPDSSQAPMVAGLDGVKLGSLRLHSERIAIAFGLLNASKGVPIRILKNLRVCGDCHTVTKLISSVYDVEIVVRDRTRFHHFRDGSCSCMDYW